MLSKKIIYLFFSLFIVISAFTVISSSYPIFALLSLASSFVISSFILLLFECELLAFLFIIVYVGAVAVLFLFAIMMLELKFNNQSKSIIKYLPIIFIIFLLLMIPVRKYLSNQFETDQYNNTFYLNKYQTWNNLLNSITDVELYGKVLYSFFVLEVLLLGLILLLVLVGVVYLTKPRNTPKHLCSQSNFKQLTRKSKLFCQNKNDK